MRWFKHMSASADDEKLALFTDKYGLEAYGFFWRVLEAIGSSTEDVNHKNAEYPTKTWSKILGISAKKFINMVQESSTIGLFNVNFNSDLVNVEVGEFNVEFFTGEPQGKRRLDVSTYEWAELRAEIFRRDDYTCQYCGKRGVKLECDHVFPFSLGGQSTPENLVTACMSCNRSKGAKMLSEWRQ